MSPPLADVIQKTCIGEALCLTTIITMENKIGMKDLTGWLKFAAIGMVAQAVLMAAYIGALLAFIVYALI